MNKNINNLCYLAGYIDGDGCFYLGKTIQNSKGIIVYEYSIQVLSVKKESVYFFAECFGGYIRQKAQRPGHKIPYQWTIKTRKCFEVARDIYPFLTDKYKSCALFIEFEAYIVRNDFKVVHEDTIKQRDNIIKSIREEKHMNDFVTEDAINLLKEIKPTIEPTEEHFCYLAGLIDSEGCFRIKKWQPKGKPNKVYTINLEIGNTRLPIFNWLMDRFGGNISFIKPKPSKRPAAIWSISSSALFRIVNNIYPFLKVKKAVCEKIIEFHATILPNGGDRHSDEFNELYRSTLAKREVIVNDIHILNAKGVHIS